jgi:hypothetical protein
MPACSKNVAHCTLSKHVCAIGADSCKFVCNCHCPSVKGLSGARQRMLVCMQPALMRTLQVQSHFSCVWLQLPIKLWLHGVPCIMQSSQDPPSSSGRATEARSNRMPSSDVEVGMLLGQGSIICNRQV